MMAFSYTSAAAFPISDVQLIFKNISTFKIIPSTTDKDGFFSVGVLDGVYNMFISDEDMPPVKLTSKNGVISGRIVVLTDGTTTQDPVTKPTKKVSKAKVKTNAVSTATSTIKSTTN